MTMVTHYSNLEGKVIDLAHTCGLFYSHPQVTCTGYTWLNNHSNAMAVDCRRIDMDILPTSDPIVQSVYDCIDPLVFCILL